MPLVDNNPIPKLAAVMDRNSTNENFEHFLRQNADEYKMRPSPKVWDGISNSLTKRKRKFYFSLFALLISSSILGYTVLEFSFERFTDIATQLSKPSEPARMNSLTGTSTPAINIKADKRSGSETKEGISFTAVVRKLEPGDNSIGNLLIADRLDKIDETNSKDLRQSGVVNLLTSSSNFDIGSPNNFLADVSSTKNPLVFDKLAAIPTEENNKLDALPKKKAGRFSMMFYFTPTVSYRKLSENKSYIRSAGSLSFSNAQLQDVNSAVSHKPNIGLEFGLTSKYAITKNVKLRAGVQFNINRYNIQASKHTPELAILSLNNGHSGVQTVGTMSTYRNVNGGQLDWLENFYFQLSTPIGAEVKLGGNDKVYIGAASTVQPTYVLGDKAYLLTTDYKNYAQVPWLMRRWNVNTNLETFVAYSTGKLKWQVGPQVRYQLLSSFANKYPVKENLFDFGLKVGISVNPNP